MGFFDNLGSIGGFLGDAITPGPGEIPGVTDPQGIIEQEDLLNRLDIISPEGGREFFVDPETGRVGVRITETPFQEGIRGQKEALASQFLTDLTGGDDRFATEAKRIGDLTFERGLSRLEPTLEKARRRTETQLATQGLPVGSEARSDRLAELGRDESDLLTQLALQSELAAGQEQSRLRNLSLQEAGVFGDVIGGVNTGQFLSGIPQIDVGGIIQNADRLNQNRASIQIGQDQAAINNALSLAEMGTNAAGGFFI
jgi:hypothetical protein